MSTSEWKKIKEEPAKYGYRNFLRKTYVLPTGVEWIYDISNSNGAACCLALTEDNQVILCRQFRPGPEKMLLEMPGGWIEKWDSPEKTIAKELLEETGYKWDIEFVWTTLDDAYSNMIRYNFVIRNCRKIQEPEYEEYEHGEVIFMSLTDFRKHLRSWELTDVETGYLCLDHLNLL